MIDILGMQCDHLGKSGRMFGVVAFQTERCIRTATDIALFRVADVLFAGTVAGLTLNAFECRVLRAYLETCWIPKPSGMTGDTPGIKVSLLFQERLVGESVARR